MRKPEADRAAEVRGDVVDEVDSVDAVDECRAGAFREVHCVHQVHAVHYGVRSAPVGAFRWNSSSQASVIASPIVPDPRYSCGVLPQ